MEPYEITQNQPKKNILQKTWNVISSIGGAVGLVSLADDWLAWTDFFQQLIKYYRTVVYFPFKIFPFEIYSWIKDYLFLTSLVTSSLLYSLHIYPYRSKDEKPKSPIMSVFAYIKKALATYLIVLATLPLFGLFWATHWYYKSKGFANLILNIYLFLGAVLLVFFCFLVANIIVGK